MRVDSAADATATRKDPRWAKVCARDSRADGSFFYSVGTTGIYCRPSCPSRRPRPENVRFHTSREQAEQAGFRPCRRCRPDAAPLAQRHAERIARVCRLIGEAVEPPGLEEMAAHAGLSPWYFHRLFKKLTGLTPRDYAAAQRAGRLRGGLQDGASVTEAIYGAGYGSSSRFYESADRLLGMKPSAYRAGGAGTEIRYSVGECSLGFILVASSERGVCAIMLGDDAALLVRQLREQFPRSRMIGGDGEFEELTARVVEFVESPAIGLELPLDVRGTAFQQRVWNAIREIEPGATASYAEVARRIGVPGAARAVAQACAANRLAVAIPCHRVVRADGVVSGYRWGVERKRALLAREAAVQRPAKRGR